MVHLASHHPTFHEVVSSLKRSRVPKPIFSIVSPSAAARLDAARGRLTGIEPPILIVAASRGAADEFAFSLAAERGATFGVARVSLNVLGR